MLGCWPEALTVPTGFAAGNYRCDVVSAANNSVSERSERPSQLRATRVVPGDVATAKASASLTSAA